MSYRDNRAFASVAALRAALELAPEDAADLILTNPGEGLTTFRFFAYDPVLEVGSDEPLSTVTIDYLGEITSDVAVS